MNTKHQTQKERKIAARKLIDAHFAGKNDAVTYKPETRFYEAGYEVLVEDYIVFFTVSKTGRILYDTEMRVDRNWLIQEAVKVRYAVISAGRMATKSFIEDFLIRRFPHIDRYTAHDIMNEIEYNQLDRKLFWGPGFEPKLEDYPEIVLQGKVKRAALDAQVM